MPLSLNTYKLKFKHQIITPVLLLLPFLVFSQNDTIPGYYRDSSGKLFIAPGTPIMLYMGTSPEKDKSVLLKNTIDGESQFYWSGHGPIHLSHLNLYLGRNITFNLFVDGLPPKTGLEYDKDKGREKNDFYYISGDCIIELQSVDPDAGILSVYYSINQEPFVKYTEPIILKDEGQYQISVYALDKVGNKEDEVTRTLVVDNTPPATELVFEGYIHENVLSGNTMIGFKSSDSLGVKETKWQIDDKKELSYTKPLSTSQLSEGEHVITWHSVDLVDNIEPQRQYAFFVDKTPPMVFEEITGNTYIIAGREYSSGRSQLKVAAVDNKSGIKEIFYSLNNKPFQRYEKPVYLSEIIGSINVRSYAVDNVNNRSTSDVQSGVFAMPEIDISGPNITYMYDGVKIKHRDTLRISPKTKIIVNAKDYGAGTNRIAYKIKGENEKTYSEPFTIPKHGFQEVTISAFDNVENINLLSFSCFVDADAPVLFHHFSTNPVGSALVNDKRLLIFPANTILYLAASDKSTGISGISYSVNGASQIKYQQPISTFKAGQQYSISVTITDLVGNEHREELQFRIE